ncbi:hypothetical protein [Sphingomonas montana]|uniref:hypothetical protein n=1 Tax=Sphingomonas montana TaxID=1843236 RepID=UPI00101AE0BE|nr:hypothetical protein [Sphingomonas montana]
MDIRKPRHVASMEPHHPIEQERPRNAGDVWAMLIANVVIIEFLTAGMARGPYSSREQELWYRYGSLGFLFTGVIIPAATMLAIRQSRFVVAFLNAWMFAILLGFMWFVAMSSGGV